MSLNSLSLSLSLSLIVIESQVEKAWKTTKRPPVKRKKSNENVGAAIRNEKT